MKRILTTGVIAGLIAATGMPASAGDARVEQEKHEISIHKAGHDGSHAKAPKATGGKLGLDFNGSIRVHDAEGGEIVLQIDNGECVCIINGEKIDPDEIETSMDDGMLVISRDGDELYRLDLPNFAGDQLGLSFLKSGDGGAWSFSTDGDLKFGSDFDKLRRFAPKPAERTLRMGVSIENVGDDVASELGISSSDALRIVDVQDDMPAKMAGIRAKDIILRVEGKPASFDNLKKVISASKAGDKLVVELIRDGHKKEVLVGLKEVEVAPAVVYDDKKLDYTGDGITWEIDSEDVKSAMANAQKLYTQKLHDHASRADVEVGKLHELIIEKLHNAQLDDDTEAKIEMALEQALSSLEDIDFEFHALPPVHFGKRGDNERILVVPEPDGTVKDEIIVRELEGQARNSEIENRLNRMEDRMSRIERLLERLVEDDN